LPRAWGAGDEAITTPLTFLARRRIVFLYQGRDSGIRRRLRTTRLTLIPAKFSKKISSRTKAIIAVDYAGHPAALDEMRGIAGRVRSDADRGPPATRWAPSFHGKRVGGHPRHDRLQAFHPVKHLTTGEGGMVTTDNPPAGGGFKDAFAITASVAKARDRPGVGAVVL